MGSLGAMLFVLTLGACVIPSDRQTGQPFGPRPPGRDLHLRASEMPWLAAYNIAVLGVENREVDRVPRLVISRHGVVSRFVTRERVQVVARTQLSEASLRSVQALVSRAFSTTRAQVPVRRREDAVYIDANPRIMDGSRDVVVRFEASSVKQLLVVDHYIRANDPGGAGMAFASFARTVASDEVVDLLEGIDALRVAQGNVDSVPVVPVLVCERDSGEASCAWPTSWPSPESGPFRVTADNLNSLRSCVPFASFLVGRQRYMLCPDAPGMAADLGADLYRDWRLDH